MPYLKNNESATPQTSSPRTSPNTTDQNTPVPTSPYLNANSNTDRKYRYTCSNVSNSFKK